MAPKASAPPIEHPVDPAHFEVIVSRRKEDPPGVFSWRYVHEAPSGHAPPAAPPPQHKHNSGLAARAGPGSSNAPQPSRPPTTAPVRSASAFGHKAGVPRSSQDSGTFASARGSSGVAVPPSGSGAPRPWNTHAWPGGCVNTQPSSFSHDAKRTPTRTAPPMPQPGLARAASRISNSGGSNTMQAPRPSTAALAPRPASAPPASSSRPQTSSACARHDAAPGARPSPSPAPACGANSHAAGAPASAWATLSQPLRPPQSPAPGAVPRPRASPPPPPSPPPQPPPPRPSRCVLPPPCGHPAEVRDPHRRAALLQAVGLDGPSRGTGASSSNNSSSSSSSRDAGLAPDGLVVLLFRLEELAASANAIRATGQCPAAEADLTGREFVVIASLPPERRGGPRRLAALAVCRQEPDAARAEGATAALHAAARGGTFHSVPRSEAKMVPGAPPLKTSGLTYARYTPTSVPGGYAHMLGPETGPLRQALLGEALVALASSLKARHPGAMALLTAHARGYEFHGRGTGPFCTVSLTEDYYNRVHVDQDDPPLSFITWWLRVADAAAREVEVRGGAFRLANARVRFTPLHGTSLLLNTRLLYHGTEQGRSCAGGIVRLGCALWVRESVAAAFRAWRAGALQLYIEQLEQQQQRRQEQGQEHQGAQPQQAGCGAQRPQPATAAAASVGAAASSRNTSLSTDMAHQRPPPQQQQQQEQRSRPAEPAAGAGGAALQRVRAAEAAARRLVASAAEDATTVRAAILRRGAVTAYVRSMFDHVVVRPSHGCWDVREAPSELWGVLGGA